MNCAILGSGSRIAQEFCGMVSGCIPVKLDAGVCRSATSLLVCTGFLPGKSIMDINAQDEEAVFRVNFTAVARYVDEFLSIHAHGRVVVIGSDSANAGSYDQCYAGAKAALHLFVETRALLPNQQLVAIAPSIVGDCSQTLRRNDFATLKRRESEHPKRRFCTAREVASLAAWLLGDEGAYVCSTVVVMNGGRRR